ncbi:DoxX family protein [Mycobacterium sp. RTGN5]|uniref:DoxX family protein n=1 Tax=Mycobacterium sp. RTGN5 TaxID=3016522 RepID=UPI0029C73E25|nr:DoxX family protein [Mycobacterium sp. RTGN5]
MGALTSPRTYTALAAFQAFDTVACGIPVAYIERSLDTLEVPQRLRPVLPTVKAMSVIGLLAARRFPALARLTTFMLTVYFVLAVGAHLRVRDSVASTVPATVLLALYAAMTVQGPSVSR